MLMPPGQKPALDKTKSCHIFDVLIIDVTAYLAWTLLTIWRLRDFTFKLRKLCGGGWQRDCLLA